MARLLTIDSCAVVLRNALLAILRNEDEGLLLPQANQSIETNFFKNIVFRLDGQAPNVNPAIFSADLFSGVSCVQLKNIDALKIEAILEDPDRRRQLLAALVDGIPSEVFDPDLHVGPQLECDDLERDVEGSEWQFGLDGTSSFVGVFSAEHSVAVEGCEGTNRVQKKFFLVCKAGAGAAAETFYARFLAAASKGLSLDQILGDGGALGGTALRRLASAAERNRGRILYAATKILGLSMVESVGDQASRSRYRVVVSDVVVVVNSIRKEDCGKTWTYAASIDGILSRGLISCSNAADGLVLFLNSTGDPKIKLKNECWSALPFSTKRLLDGKNMVKRIAAQQNIHKDATWLQTRFGWKNRVVKPNQPSALPFTLWGSHATETFSSTFSRELGVSHLVGVRLRPELVAVAGVEAGKLRAL